MSAQHTPGPWWISTIHKYGGYLNDGGIAVVSEGGRIATVDCHAKFKRGMGAEAQCETRDANAHLIAAAPQLLEALEALVNSFEKHRPKALWDAARAAIAAAKGAA